MKGKGKEKASGASMKQSSVASSSKGKSKSSKTSKAKPTKGAKSAESEDSDWDAEEEDSSEGSSESSSGDTEESSSDSEDSSSADSAKSSDDDGWGDVELEINEGFKGINKRDNKLRAKEEEIDDDDDEGWEVDFDPNASGKDRMSERAIIDTLKAIDGMITEARSQTQNALNNLDDDGDERLSDDIVKRIIAEFHKLSGVFQKSPNLIDLAIRTHTLPIMDMLSFVKHGQV